ncbi:MAG: nuclear transport factor 2 family protein [Casimicrobiaceae bacterium]
MTTRAPTPSRLNLALAGIGLALLTGCAANAPRPTNADLQKQVAATERAFAKTMADRNHAAFVAFLADEAIFFTGPTPLRGKEEVAVRWKRFYEKPDAPFSWAPDKVEVLDSGTLALSSGPVYDPSGKLLATFTSIWRQEAPGVWRIVFDKGNDVCDCAKTP